MNLKLGKLPPRHDPRTFKLESYLTQLPPIPSAINWSLSIPSWGMLMNDQLGDCAIAAPGHMEMLWTSQTGTEFIPTDEQIVAAYSAITGYKPGDPSTDNGSVMLDVLNFWRNAGIAGRSILAYAQVNYKNQNQIRAAISLFGGLYVGVRLPQSAMDQTNAQQSWDGITDENIIGGHAINLVAYDDWTVSCVTWGRIQQMTWTWLQHYADEAYVPLSNDWIAANGVAPSGFNQQQLIQDLKSL